MNNRDPFNLRHNSSSALSLLRSNTAFIRGSLVEGSEALGHGLNAAAHTVTTSMSSYAPYAIPTQRTVSEQWQGTGRLRHAEHENGGIAEKVTGFFGADQKDSLPMYKDKPYGHPGGRGRWSFYRRRRPIAVILLALTGVCWWFGLLSGSPVSTKPVRDSSNNPAPWMSWKKVDWVSRAQEVKETFKISFAGYEKYAWGYDEYSPVSKRHKQMTPNGLGWMIIDALDTMMLMDLSDELAHARQWIGTNLTWDQDHDVNTFETTIRMLGGLLSAHYLSTEFPGQFAPVDDDLGGDLYIEKATDLADRLLGAYESTSGVPYASINLHTMKGIPSHADDGASSTAEATTLQLEMKYLAKLTGEDHYWKHAEHVMKVVDDNHAPDGLVPIFIYADRGAFRGQNIRLGSRGDSYYEYLIKQYLQTSEEEPVYHEMWDETLDGVKKHLITYSNPSNFTVLAERPNGLRRDISAKMDHLVCFMPGTIALATTKGMSIAEAKTKLAWGPKQDEDIRLAEDLMKTCWGMYKVTPSGLAGEITHFNIYDPPHMYNDYAADAKPPCPDAFDAVDNQIGKEDFIIKIADAHNRQRPETVESLFYMWRITGDQKYRDWGWEMYENFVRWMVVEDGDGFTSLHNVMVTPPSKADNMESFWLAETLKYFYLLFSPDDLLPLTDVVFNTEAHPFPRFSLGRLFETGWQRSSSGSSNAAAHEESHSDTDTRDSGDTAVPEVENFDHHEEEAHTPDSPPAETDGGDQPDEEIWVAAEEGEDPQ